MLFYEFVPRMVTYVTEYAVDVPYVQTVHQISNANINSFCGNSFE